MNRHIYYTHNGQIQLIGYVTPQNIGLCFRNKLVLSDTAVGVMDAQRTQESDTVTVMEGIEAVDDMVVMQEVEVEVRDEGEQDQFQQDAQLGMVMDIPKHAKADDAVVLAEGIQGYGDVVAREGGTRNIHAGDAEDAVVLLAVRVDDALEEIQLDRQNPQVHVEDSNTFDPTTSRTMDVKAPYACDSCKQTFNRSSSFTAPQRWWASVPSVWSEVQRCRHI